MAVILRPACETDEPWVYGLVLDRLPDLEEADHLNWWAANIDDIQIAELDGYRIGHVRIDADNEVHITVASTHQGRGYGTEMLQAVARPWLKAIIAETNLPSQSAFAKAGFRKTSGIWTYTNDKED